MRSPRPAMKSRTACTPASAASSGLRPDLHDWTDSVRAHHEVEDELL